MVQSGFGFWKIVLTTIVTVLFFAAFTAVASADTYYVATTGDDDIGDGSSGNRWRTIQHAVNTITDGNTIIVRDGTYTENVNVNKPHLTIRSENGAEKTIVYAANPDDDVFFISPRAGFSGISGFTIKGGNRGIRLHCAHSIISNNKINSNEGGIFVNWNGYNAITNNNISDNGYGIVLYNSGWNTITKNTIISSNGAGISFRTLPPLIKATLFISITL